MTRVLALAIPHDRKYRAQALHWIEAAVASGSNPAHLRADSSFLHLRHDARFMAIIQGAKAPCRTSTWVCVIDPLVD